MTKNLAKESFLKKLFRFNNIVLFTIVLIVIVHISRNNKGKSLAELSSAKNMKAQIIRKLVPANNTAGRQSFSLVTPTNKKKAAPAAKQVNNLANPVVSKPTMPPPEKTITAARTPRLKSVKELYHYFQQGKMAEAGVFVSIPFDSFTQSFTIKLPANIFGAGQSQIPGKLKTLLFQLAKLTTHMPTNLGLLVIGHSDKDPVQKLAWEKNSPKTNESLSIVRAQNVVKQLTMFNLNPANMDAIGTGFHLRPTRSVSIKFLNKLK